MRVCFDHYFRSFGESTSPLFSLITHKQVDQDHDITIQQDQAELVFWYDVSGLTDTAEIDKAFKTLVNEKFTEAKNA